MSSYWSVAQRVVASQPCVEAISVDRKGSPGIGTECHKRVCKLRSVLSQWRRAGDTPLGRNSNCAWWAVAFCLLRRCRPDSRDTLHPENVVTKIVIAGAKTQDPQLFQAVQDELTRKREREKGYNMFASRSGSRPRIWSRDFSLSGAVASHPWGCASGPR